MPDTPTPLLDRAARFAAMATTESESLVTELADELRRVMAERDVYRYELFQVTTERNALIRWGTENAEAVRKAAGLEEKPDA